MVFGKPESTQDALFKLLQSWQKELDYGGFVETILMNLSKAYDCILHELLVAKLECYGLDELRFKLIRDLILLIVNKGLRQALHSVIGLTYPLVFHKIQSFDRF